MARPRIIPLRDQAGYGVDDLAPFTLLAYMCWPAREDGYKRTRALQYIKSETATGRRTRGDSLERMLGQDHDQARRGLHAGLFTLMACQLFENRLKPTVANIALAIRLQREQAGINAKVIGAAKRPWLVEPLVWNSRDELIANFNTFYSVAHLWAAYLWIAEDASTDPRRFQRLLGRVDSVPHLMGVAATIAWFAHRVPRGRAGQGQLLDPDSLWWSDLGMLTVPAIFCPPAMDSELIGQLQA